MSPRSFLASSVVLLSVVALGGCFVENDPAPNRVIVVDPNNGPAQPQLLEPSSTAGYAKIVTGAAIKASPGQGAGVFVEYKGGGDWTIWTTCDSALGNGACNYIVDVQPTTGAIVQSAALLPDSYNDDTISFSAGGATATLRTLGEVDGMSIHLDPPSAGLVVTAYVDGSADPKFLYWIGPDLVEPHMGAPYDPMQFDPTTP